MAYSRDSDDGLQLKDSDLISEGCYEHERIAVLQQERVYVQKKTFTIWCNSYLERVNLQINNLFVDLSDGINLMKLLELVSGEHFGRPNRGLFRVQKMENVSRCLNFLATKVTFENISAADIVDGKEKLILGLIWTIILRFQIQQTICKVESSEHQNMSAKDALLLWCQKKTEGYCNVKIKNFSSSWRNGLGFNALIHSYRPDLISFESLNPNDHIGNLNHAFDIAEKKLGITRLLDAEDVDTETADNRSIMTYISAYYNYFEKDSKTNDITEPVVFVSSPEKENSKPVEKMSDASESMVLVSLPDKKNSKHVEKMSDTTSESVVLVSLPDKKNTKPVEKISDTRESVVLVSLPKKKKVPTATLR